MEPGDDISVEPDAEVAPGVAVWPPVAVGVEPDDVPAVVPTGALAVVVVVPVVPVLPADVAAVPSEDPPPPQDASSPEAMSMSRILFC